jgi:hypothetical protein
MKFIVIFAVLIKSLLFAEDQIVNETKEPMLCTLSSTAKYEMQLINGINQRVQTQEQKYATQILMPNQSYTRKKDEIIVCYNQYAKISSSKSRDIKSMDRNAIEIQKRNHELFDISSYANEDKNFVETKYGTSNQCKEYGDGEYCKIKEGLDIFYTKSGRVKKIFIYGSSFFGQSENLPFEIDSFYKIKANNEPLGLWVNEKNKELLKSKPTVESDNIIMWTDPTPMISKVIMTPKNGYINLYRYMPKEQEQKLQDYLQAIEVEYVLDDAAYALHQKTRIMPTLSPFANPHKVSVEPFPRKAKSTWGESLNPSGQIPTNKFKAFYINTKNPKTVIASEDVTKVSVNYVWDKFHGIISEDFGAYWVGNFNFEKTKDMSINLSQSWSKTRIIVDGMVIYEGGTNSEIPFTFTKGAHKIEVEYVNNWHTTNFMVNLIEKEKIYTQEEINKELQKNSSKNSVVLFGGVYESKNKDQSITLKMAKFSQPVILILDSYQSIEWRIKNPYHVKIEAIIYSSHQSGVEIKGDIPKSIPILKYKGHIGSYTMKQNCSCINGGALFHCEGNNGIDTIKSIETFSGHKLFGVSGAYGADTLMLPSMVIDDKKIKELNEEILNVEKQRKSCQKETNPNFETMLKND